LIVVGPLLRCIRSRATSYREGWISAGFPSSFFVPQASP
jgi:hypothetical protein